MPSSAYCDSIPCDGRMKSGTQLHSSFSELYHTVKPTDSNECWLWPFAVSWKLEVLRMFVEWRNVVPDRRPWPCADLCMCWTFFFSFSFCPVFETLWERGWPQGTVNGRWFFQFSSNSPTALNVHWGKNRPDGDQEWQSAETWRGHGSTLHLIFIFMKDTK